MAKPKSNAQMRLDSAHVYDDAEAIRVVVSDLAERYPKLLRHGPLYRLHRTYGAEVWVGMGGSGDKRRRNGSCTRCCVPRP